MEDGKGCLTLHAAAMAGALLLSFSSVFAQVGFEGDEDFDGPLARVPAYYVFVEPYEQLVEDLPLLDIEFPADMETALSLGARALYETAHENVLEVRRRLDEAQERMVIDMANYLRLRNVTYDGLKLKGYEYRAGALIFVWWGRLYEEFTADEERRKIARDFYDDLAASFHLLSEKKQVELLATMQKRMEDLKTERRRIFELIESQRLQYALQIAKARGSQRVAEDLDDWFADPSVVPEPTPEEIADAANAMLKDPNLKRAYLWLVPETALHVELYGRLLERREEVLVNGVLHDRLMEARRADLALGPHDSVPPVGNSRETRMEIFRLRARRGQLLIHLQEAQLEAAFKRSTSMLQSVGQSLGAFVRDGKAVLSDLPSLVERAVASTNLMDDVDSGVTQSGAAFAAGGAAVAYRLLGDLMGIVVVQPLVDTLKSPIKSVFNPFGAGIQDSVDKAFASYHKQRDALELRFKLLENLATQHTLEQAQGYVRSVRTGGESGQGWLEQIAPIAVSEILRDPTFAAATDGGLPGIFTILCEDPRDLAALHVRGALEELRGDALAAGSRIALARGLAQVEGDQLSREAVERIVHPLAPTAENAPDALAGFWANWVYLAAEIPRAIVVDYMWNAPTKFELLFTYAKGDAGDQDAYLRGLQKRQDAMWRFQQLLKEHDFDYDELERQSEDGWLLHQGLLATSHEYTQAYRRIRKEFWERERQWLWARHEDEQARREGTEPTLTSTGRYALADTQALSEMEDARLAYQAAKRKLFYLSLTGDFAAAAAQVRAFEPIDEHLRRTLNIQPFDVDYSEQARILELRAARNGLVSVYAGLFQTALFETVISLTSHTIQQRAMANTTATGKVRFNPRAPPDGWTAGMQKVRQTLNPWAGKFSREGVYNTVRSAGVQAIRESAAQVAGKLQNVFTEKELDTALDALFSVMEETSDGLSEEWANAEIDWQADTENYKARQNALDYSRAELSRALSRGDVEHQRRARAAIFLLSGDLAQTPAARNRVLDDARSHAVRTSSQLVEAAVTTRVEARAPTDLSDLSSLAQDVERGQIARARDKLHARDVREVDMGRLVDANDGLALHKQVFRTGFDITAIRRALTRAVKNDPRNREKLLAHSMTLDMVRARRTEAVISSFLLQSKWGGKVHVLVETNRTAILSDDPDARGALNAPGIHSDLIFDFVVEADAPGKPDDFRRELEAYFEQHGYDRPGYEGQRNTLGVRFYAQSAAELGASGRKSGQTARIAKVFQGARLKAKKKLEDVADLEQRPLDPGLAAQIENLQGFSFEHAQRIQLYANLHEAITIVRNGNPDSLKWFDNILYMAKPMSCKAKTAKVGPHIGLVVNPRHEFQAGEWKDAIDSARAAGDTARVDELEYHHERALTAWDEHGAKMLSKKGGYSEDKTGRITYGDYKGIHGDYDMHGVFVRDPKDPKRFLRVSYGNGKEHDNNNRKGFRSQFDNVIGFIKNMLQHGGQDDWDHPGKTSDPPVTIFVPKALEAQLGVTSPVFLDTPEAMRDFYENKMNTGWAYSDGHGDLLPPPEGTTSLTSFFRPSGSSRWDRNRAAFRKVTVGGVAMQTRWTTIPMWQGYGMCADLAPRLVFLADPRFTRTSVDALPNDHERLAVLEEALRKADAFVDLVDAWLVSHPIGNDIYNSNGRFEEQGRRHWLRSLDRSASPSRDRPTVVTDAERGSLGRLAAKMVGAGLETRESHRVQVVRDLDTLLAEATRRRSGPDETREVAVALDDRDSVEFTFLVEMLEVGAQLDPFSAAGAGGRTPMGIEIALGLLEWMRELAPRLYADIGTSFHAEFVRMQTDGSRVETGYVEYGLFAEALRPGEQARKPRVKRIVEGYASIEVKGIVAVLERLAGESPLAAAAFLQPPIVSANGRVKAVDRRKLEQAIRANMQAVQASWTSAAPMAGESVGSRAAAALLLDAPSGEAEAAQVRGWAETWKELLR